MKTPWPVRALCFLIGVMVGMVVLWQLTTELRKNSAAETTGASVTAARQESGPPKPWGNLEALRIPFADSSEIFPDRAARLQKPKWFFENSSPDQLLQLFHSCELAPEQQKELMDKSHWEIVSNGCFVLPSESLVRTLHHSTRQKIYSILQTNPLNYSQQYPFRFPPDDFVSRFAEGGLSPDKLQIIQSLTYTNGGDLCLADVQALPGLLSADEFDRAIDCLYRFPVYRLRLRVRPDSDINALVNYWGRGGREKKIRPFLESLAKAPKKNGTSITITFLLPTFARLRLYTFPNSWPDSHGKEDCFWTSMNFFNEQPDPRLADGAQLREVLQTEYRRVTGEPTFGDLMTLIDRNGNGLHMCVYIADNFVYTKNGNNPLSPWVIMKTSDMLLYFPTQQERLFVVYRRKEL